MSGEIRTVGERWSDERHEYYLLEGGEGADRNELAGIKDLRRGPDTVEELGRAVSWEFGVEEEELYRPRRVLPARSIMTELCRVY